MSWTEAKKDVAVPRPPPLKLSRVLHATRETVFKAWKILELKARQKLSRKGTRTLSCGGTSQQPPGRIGKGDGTAILDAGHSGEKLHHLPSCCRQVLAQLRIRLQLVAKPQHRTDQVYAFGPRALKPKDLDIFRRESQFLQ